MTLLEAITLSRSLEAKATAGPWYEDSVESIVIHDRSGMRSGDTEFICHTRNTHAKFVESCRVMMDSLDTIQDSELENEPGVLCWEAKVARDALETVRKIWEE